MVQVLDYSAGFPGAANIRRERYLGAVRYIGFPDRRKCTTAAELKDFSANGLGMALVYEDNADDWRGGYARGQSAGQRARNHATQIGFPPGRPVYMAVDRDVVTEAEFRTMVEYLRGASTTLGGVHLTGVYGEHDVCRRAAEAGVAQWMWQCRAWSGTPAKLYAGRHLYQFVGTVTVGGVACDFNDVLQGDWGQHNATRSVEVSILDETMERFSWDGKEHGRAGDLIANAYSYTKTLATVQLPAVLSAVAAMSDDPDITPEALAKAIDDATPNADEIAAELRPGIVTDLLPLFRVAMIEALAAHEGATAEETADAVLRKISEHLAGAGK